MSRAPFRCSFCGIGEAERTIVHGPNVCVCEECVVLLHEIVVERYAFGPPTRKAFAIPECADTAVPTFSSNGFVYFLHAPLSRRVKIGFSFNPNSRIGAILTSCPEELVFLGAIPGDIKTEREFHSRFAALRAHREWFEATPELLAYIGQIVAA